jgi:Flp pilus assembly protein CpaB
MKRKRSTVPKLGSLPATRHGAVVLALACAVAAAGIIIVALGQYRKGVTNSNKQVTVLVAQGLIERGTSADVIAAQGLVKPTPFIASKVSPGAITDAKVIRGEVTAQSILPGQQLTATDFTTAGGVATELAPNERAVDVAFDGPRGLTDVLQPGDHVDVYASLDVNFQAGVQYSPTQGVAPVSAPGQTSATPQAQEIHLSRLLIPDARVLKVVSGSGGGLSGGSSGAGGSVMLAISSDDVAQAALVNDNGKLWLALRSANATSPSPIIAMGTTVLTGFHFTLLTTVQANRLIFHQVLSTEAGGH